MKVTEYTCFESFENDSSKQDYEHIALVPHGKDKKLCADLITECARANTAIRRFFKALKGYPEHTGWEDEIIEAVQNGVWSEKEQIWDENKRECVYTGGWFWEVENIGDNLWYICLKP